MRTPLLAAFVAVSVFVCLAGDSDAPLYRVLPPITERNLTVFPVTASTTFDTTRFITLDEGLRSGLVTVTEAGRIHGFVRPLGSGEQGHVWTEIPPGTQNPDPGIYPPGPPLLHQHQRTPDGPSVNNLELINQSDRPLILLAGEIVTGGKQDRVVGKDRIIPSHSDPVALDVFCVEPHRWTGASMSFDGTASAMAQPGVRLHAMADQNQQQVWDEVAKSRAALSNLLPAPEAAKVYATSSYASALDNTAVQSRLNSMAAPIGSSYSGLIAKLRAVRAVGVVAAVNGRLIWADVFASTDLLDRYWPKLVRSYAAEALTETPANGSVTQQEAQMFLDRLYGGFQTIDTEPNLYRSTRIQGDGFKVFVLTSLLPGTGYRVHLVKMRN